MRYGGRSLPAYAFTPEYPENRFVREYINLMDNIGINQKDRGCEITMELFKNGCCLYAWDTSYVYVMNIYCAMCYMFVFFVRPDLCFSRAHRHVRLNGGLDLHIKFAAALLQPMVVFVMAW